MPEQPSNMHAKFYARKTTTRAGRCFIEPARLSWILLLCCFPRRSQTRKHAGFTVAVIAAVCSRIKLRQHPKSSKCENIISGPSARPGRRHPTILTAWYLVWCANHAAAPHMLPGRDAALNSETVTCRWRRSIEPWSRKRGTSIVSTVQHSIPFGRYLSSICLVSTCGYGGTQLTCSKQQAGVATLHLDDWTHQVDDGHLSFSPTSSAPSL